MGLKTWKINSKGGIGMLSAPAWLSDRFLWLGRPFFSSYLLLGDQYALIEAGISCSALEVIKQMQALQIDQRKLRYLILMHAHPDHTTGLLPLREQYPWLQIASSEKAAEMLKREKVLSAFWEEDQFLCSALAGQKISQQRWEQRKTDPLIVQRILRDGDHIDLGGGIQLTALLTPGHSPCSLSIWQEEMKALFISDAAGFEVSLQQDFPCYFYSYSDYIESLRRLLEKEAEVLAPAHRPPILGKEAVAKYLQRAIATAETLCHHIQQRINDGQPATDIEQHLVTHYYHDNLTLYSQRNIQGCVNALIKQSRIAPF